MRRPKGGLAQIVANAVRPVWERIEDDVFLIGLRWSSSAQNERVVG